jgi:transposase
MDQTSLFTAALGLQSPWEVVDVRFSEQEHRIDFDIAFEAGTRFACPKCSAKAQAIHDTRSREWRHLNFFQFDAHIHTLDSTLKCNFFSE